MELNTHRQVTYLISKPAHFPYLVCSLFTLRKYWDGHIEVHTWPESYEIAKLIEGDNRLKIHVVKREPKLKDGYGNNSQRLDRIDMSMNLNCGCSLYMDADTTIHGKIDRLFNVAELRGFCMTQWSDWTTDQDHVQSKVADLFDVEDIPNDHVETITTHKWPSVNSGVWATIPNSQVLPLWYSWTKKCKSLSFSDERVLHLMMSARSHEVAVCCEYGKYNNSPIFQSQYLKDKDIVVMHYHGNSNVQPDKSERGHKLWWPIFKECCDKNVGNIVNWISRCDNSYLNLLLKDKKNFIFCG